MTDPVRETHDMIAGMSPQLRDGVFGFVSVDSPAPDLIASAIALFREDEAVSLILPLEMARTFGEVTPMRCITLRINSSLEGIGLTAAVGTTLAEAEIAVNVVAATHHDHLFVPAADAEAALERLVALQKSKAG